MIINSSSKIIVGITQRIDSIAGRDELRDALDQRLIQWVVRAGFLPLAIPNTLLAINHSGEVSDETTLEGWLKSVQPDALILSGGNDIGEYAQRDATESHLLSWAETKRVPVLGICRGLQMMAVWAGADLARIDGHAGTRHDLVALVDESEWPVNVNSYHNWGLSSCPEKFGVMAQAEDGCIEAIRHISLSWEGWMWHPEREMPFAQNDIKRLKRLFGGK